MFGYDQGVVANVLVMRDFVERWPVGPWEKGLTSESTLRVVAVWLNAFTEVQHACLDLSLGVCAGVHSGDVGAWIACRCLDRWNLRGPIFAKAVHCMRLPYVFIFAVIWAGF